MANVGSVPIASPAIKTNTNGRRPMKILMISAAAVLSLLGAASAASANPVEGAAIGAGSGLLIAGPPGAVVGGVAGAIVGGKHGRPVQHTRAWYRAHRHTK
jgi:outer membrane lipoprotein SlyB